MKKVVIAGIIVTVITMSLASWGYAAKLYEGTVVNVISQPRPEWNIIDKYLPEFEKETGIDVRIKYLSELERRSKERLDASTRTGSYQVYYLDEANVAEFASAGWVLPLLDYYPTEYDFDDFMKAWVGIASYEGIPYFAPTLGAGDFFMYRKDVLIESGLLLPTTLDELMDSIQKTNNPPTLYGTVTRCLRGSGMNVWRWAPFFKGFGGQWLEGNKPIFNSPPAVEATEYYLEMLKYAPPGCGTFSWGDCIEAFRAGKVTFFIDADVFYDWCEDPEKSNVVGKIGYTAPPAPLLSAGCSHGLGISAPGCKTEKVRQAAALFIAWATSKQMEIQRVENGVTTSYARESTLSSPQMAKAIPPFLIKALGKRAAVTTITIMRRPEWPEIGDMLGIILEELFTGARTDIQAALDEAVDYAAEVLARER